MTINRFVVTALAVFAVFVVTASAVSAAQEPSGAEPSIQQLRVQILPEYDDPRVLVIIQGRLATNGSTFSGPVTFRLPAGAQINQMAVLDLEQGAPQPQPFDTRSDPVDASWMLVTYTLTNPHFFYEYYYDPILGSEDKQLPFVFSTLQVIEELLIEIQQPLAATNFTLEPPGDLSRTDSSGFTYYRYQSGLQPAGAELTFQARYTKTDPAPSVSRQAISSPAQQAPAAGQAATPGTTPLWAAGLVAVVVVTGLASLVGYRQRSRRVAEGADPGRLAPAATPGQAHFCTQCGYQLPEAAHFCPACGAAVRSYAVGV
ncbi:MAG: zinc ribbon domain-containing protein [Chloroflexi bacterium]|nr:zinc ribbon domain-containing protein [Chloroflexota bacterium]MCI0578548.1 zinc ribbon domain-containing protein [Chloroflexota bacterium]MCI0647456.1 zinc ribbon domain-containing protein [Chloroflexota bacterium]MCI0731123.1 zinc ribbon domain-containing protein [Chloroflexota bacterium]